MAKIDVKFMKGNKTTAKNMGSTYTKSPAKRKAGGTRRKGVKK